FALQSCAAHRDLHSFPTRRSSDLNGIAVKQGFWEAHFVPAKVGDSRPERGVTYRNAHHQAKRESAVNDPLPELRMFPAVVFVQRSEEHTSELQSQSNLVCRLLLEK